MSFPTGWIRYKEIVIQDDQVDGNLSAYPFLVWFDNDAEVGASGRADGFDIRFTVAPHGAGNVIPHERISHSVAGGLATGRYWAIVPTILATGGATIRMWYGKADAADGSTAYWLDVPNYSVEQWNDPPTVPTGWTLTAGSSSRNAAAFVLGLYSVNLQRSGTNAFLRTDIHTYRGIAWWKGKAVSVGAWIRSTVANRTDVTISAAGDGETASAAHSGSGNWEFLTATRTIGTGATAVRLTFRAITNDQTSQFDVALCNGESWSAAWIKLHKANVLSADHEQTWGAEVVDIINWPLTLGSISQSQTVAQMGAMTQAFQVPLIGAAQSQTIAPMTLAYHTEPAYLFTPRPRTRMFTPRERTRIFNVTKGN